MNRTKGIRRSGEPAFVRMGAKPYLRLESGNLLPMDMLLKRQNDDKYIKRRKYWTNNVFANTYCIHAFQDTKAKRKCACCGSTEDVVLYTRYVKGPKNRDFVMYCKECVPFYRCGCKQCRDGRKNYKKLSTG